MRRRPDPEFASPPSAPESTFSDAYSDTSVDLDTCSDTQTGDDVASNADEDFAVYSGGEAAKLASNHALDAPDAQSDSEAEAIMKHIARFRQEGPSRPRHTPRTIELWQRESQLWRQYVSQAFSIVALLTKPAKVLRYPTKEDQLVRKGAAH